MLDCNRLKNHVPHSPDQAHLYQTTVLPDCGYSSSSRLVKLINHSTRLIWHPSTYLESIPVECKALWVLVRSPLRVSLKFGAESPTSHLLPQRKDPLEDLILYLVYRPDPIARKLQELLATNTHQLVGCVSNNTSFTS
ncbi:basic form of pathogenesis-related protein 1-like [Dorcoceras hygrometricum]|uniref:Basic form of pathogenesis-related protein 1-like n=1 Tax=Dorcoceras hygrometricum TaxID=472368 RepID=A0A2Z7A427_9LAMI|nr:basic form of pathogenesis-related protein 1-like [Dorcoceras hygrometricum]